MSQEEQKKKLLTYLKESRTTNRRSDSAAGNCSILQPLVTFQAKQNKVQTGAYKEKKYHEPLHLTSMKIYMYVFCAYIIVLCTISWNYTVNKAMNSLTWPLTCVGWWNFQKGSTCHTNASKPVLVITNWKTQLHQNAKYFICPKELVLTDITDVHLQSF